MSAIVGQNCGATHSFNGFRLAAAYGGGSPDPCCGANISGTGTQVAFYNIWWDQAATHLAVTQAAVVGLGAKQNINGSAIGGNPNMTAGYHIYCANGAIIQPDGGNLPQLTVNGSTGGQNGGGFAVCSTLAFFEAYYASISGGGNWSGQRYLVNANAILNTHGQGANYLPGNVAGGRTLAASISEETSQ